MGSVPEKSIEQYAEEAVEKKAEKVEAVKPANPIKLEVISDKKDHFAVIFNRPGLVEVTVLNGSVVAHVYDGVPPDVSADPIGAYDGTNDSNKNWEA